MNNNQVPTNQTTPPQGNRWAYYSIEVRTKILSGTASNLDALNAAGAEGWEAVGITSSSGNNYQVLLKKAY